MKRKFLLLAMMLLTLMGGVKFNTLKAQTPVTIDGTVGNWTANANPNAPLNANNTYTLSQQIYLAEELVNVSSGSTFSSIAFRLNALGVTPCDRSIKIYIANTTESSFPITKYRYKMNSSDLVYEGTITLTQSQIEQNDGWVEIVFNKNTFKYEGGNILLCVWDYTGSKCGKATSFKTYKDAKFGSNNKLIIRNIYKTAVNIDPTSDDYLSTSFSTASSNYNTLPQVQFTYTSGGITINKPVFSDVPSHYKPENNAPDVFNPFFQFVATNTSHYKILVGTNEDVTEGVKYIKGGANSWETKDVDTTTVTTDFYSDLEADKTYYWKVIAKNVGVGIESDTVSSAVFNFTTSKFEAPDAATYTNPDDGKTLYDFPELSWEYAENTAKYRLLLGESDVFSLNENVENNDIEVNWTTARPSGGSYQTRGLAAGTYYWRVDVWNAAGPTEGETRSFTLSAPNNISEATANINENTLSWTFADGTTQYRVLLGKKVNDELQLLWHVGNDDNWVETNGNIGTAIIPEDLDANTKYYWAVDVKNPIGQKIYWNYVDDITKPVYFPNGNFSHYEEKLEPQVDVYSFTSASFSSVKNSAPANGTITEVVNPILTWNYVGDATEYRVFLGTDKNVLTAKTDWLPRGEEATGLAGSGSYQTENLVAANEYFWRVDVKKGEYEKEGNVWSFVATLPATKVVADPAKILPTTNGEGSTKVNWSTMEGAIGYNIYLDDKSNDNDTKQKLNEILVTEKPFTITGLNYNITEGYDIYVQADYGELGKTMSEPLNVKVSGRGTFNGIIYNNDLQNRLKDATVTLTFVEDEFGRTPSGDGIITEYVWSTNSLGQIYDESLINGTINTVTDFSLINGTYNYKVEKTDYTTQEGTIVINTNNESNSLSVTLKSDNIFDVTLTEVSFYSVKINLATAKYGNYHVYLIKDGGEPQYLGEQTFNLNPGNITVSWTYTDWANLGRGNYLFGVSTTEGGYLNKNEGVEFRYDVFDGSGDWTTASCWRDNEVPTNGATVYILANATIAKGSDIKAGNVYIMQNQQKSSLTINGSLTANYVYNNAGPRFLCINDGGQLRQKNDNLEGKFVMNIANPSLEDLANWGDEGQISATGWQFISSPAKEVQISTFKPANQAQGDYDLYRYDAANMLWRNHKTEYGENDENAYEFGDVFIQGKGYLASYSIPKEATFSGILNHSETRAWQFSNYDEKNPMANFHLIGNPFTFDMDWSEVVTYSVYPAFATVDPSTGGYIKSIESGVTTIPVGDGFFIQTTNEEPYPSISYGTASKSRGEEKADYINIIATGKQGSNNVIVKFDGAEETGFSKLENINQRIADLYVKNNGRQYSILGYDQDVQEIEVFFAAKEMGSYSISLDINGDFENVVLVDRLTGVETNMLIEDEYSFIAASNDNPNRFFLRLDNEQQTTANSHFAYVNNGDIVIYNIEGNAQINIIDATGRCVYNGSCSDAMNRVPTGGFSAGIYVIQKVDENGVNVQKIIL